MSRPWLMTSRIQLEPMTVEQLPLLVELDADAEVLRYILGRARDASEAREFWGPICADTDADAAGLGWWIGRRRSDSEFLGWWDLSPDQPVLEHPSRAQAGWRLVRRHWGQGYATEGAAQVLDHGFATVGLDTVWAETMAVNLASLQVMTNLGMRHVRTDHRRWDDPLPGAEQGEVIYELTRSESTDAHRHSALEGLLVRLAAAEWMTADEVARAGVGVLDVALENGRFYPPLAAAPDFDRRQFARTHQCVGLRSGDVQHLSDI